MDNRAAELTTGGMAADRRASRRAAQARSEPSARKQYYRQVCRLGVAGR